MSVVPSQLGLRPCNLLPSSIRRQRILRSGVVRWARWLVAVGVGVLMFAAWHAREHVARTERVEALRQETEPLLQARERSARNRERIDGLRSQLDERKRLVPDENTLDVLDLVGRGWQSAGGGLSMDTIHVERQRVPLGTGRSGHSTRVEVTGVAVDDVVLSRFVARLRREVLTGRVELQAARAADVEGRMVREYVVVCTFE